MSDDPRSESQPASEPSGADRAAERASTSGSLGCQPSLEELYRYMDGFLDDGRRERIRSHLEACGGCDELYHFHTGLRHLVGRRCQADLPPDLPQRVFKAITDLR